MTKDEFTAIMATMEEYFEKSLSASVIEIYWNEFKDWSSDKFQSAFNNLVHVRVYPGFPKIAEIQEAINGKEQDQASIAYSFLMDALKNYAFWDSIVFQDGAISNAIEAMGGWLCICDITRDEWKFKRKEFEQLYTAYRARGMNEPKKVIGYIEMTNGELFKKNNPKPILIGFKESSHSLTHKESD